jgi:hypothetical protein
VRVAQAIALSLAEEAARQEAAGGAGGAPAGGAGGGAVESSSAGSDGSGSLKRALSPAAAAVDDANSRRQRTADAAEQARARAARSALPRRRNKPLRLRCVARTCAASRRRSRDADAHRTRLADTTHPPHLRWRTRMKTQTWQRCATARECDSERCRPVVRSVTRTRARA